MRRTQSIERNTYEGPERSTAPRRFLSLSQVLDMLSISRSTLYANIHNDEMPFPKPVHIGRRSVWLEREVLEYMSTVVRNCRSSDLGQH